MHRVIPAFMCCCLVSSALAAERLVPGQYTSIQQAIDAAQDGDVVIVEPGTYHETIRFRGKAITVRASDLSSWRAVQKTVIAGWNTHSSCVVFDQGETNASILDGFMLWAGQGSVVSSSFRAGGLVLCVSSSPTIRRCFITNGYASYGGGIALLGTCHARIMSCFITNNWAGKLGGGVLIRREVTTPVGGPPAGRVPVSAAGEVLPGDVSPSDTLAADSGPAIINCTIADNMVDDYGAAPYRYDVDCWDTEPVFLNTIISGSGPSLLIADLSYVSHCCIRETHLFRGDYESSTAIVDVAEMVGSFGGAPGFVKMPAFSLIEELYGDEYHLDVTSPCVNAGSAAALEFVQRDIDGEPRLMSARIDIGADEVQPMLVVTTPSYDDVWVSGSVRNILWKSHLYDGTIDLHFNAGDGTWRTIASNLPNTGSYAWEVPGDVDSNTCMLAISSHERDPTVLRIDCGRFTIHPDWAGPEVDSAWPSLGGNSRRTGLSEAQGPALTGVRWRFETGGAVVTSVTAGFEGRVHIACEDGKLHTLDADGRPLWVYAMDSAALSSPTVGPDGSLFVGSERGTLYAIDINGKTRWTYRTGGAICSSPAVGASGNVYVGSADGVVYALANDGTELWRFRTRGPGVRPTGAIFASPAIGADGSVYVAGLYDPNLYALNAGDGSVKWVCKFTQSSGQSQLASWPFVSPVVAEDGTIYQVLLHDTHLHAIERGAGKIVWSVDLADPSSAGLGDQEIRLNGEVWSEPVLGPDGTIYVSTGDPYLRAVHPDGYIKWAKRLGEAGGFTLTVDGQGFVYGASEDGYVYRVSPEGAETGRLALSGLPVFPVVAADDLLVVADSKDYSLLVTNEQNTIWAISSKAMENEP